MKNYRVTEASALELAPGQWPRDLTLKGKELQQVLGDTALQIKEVERDRAGEVVSVTYTSTVELKVYND